MHSNVNHDHHLMKNGRKVEWWGGVQCHGFLSTHTAMAEPLGRSFTGNGRRWILIFTFLGNKTSIVSTLWFIIAQAAGLIFFDTATATTTTNKNVGCWLIHFFFHSSSSPSFYRRRNSKFGNLIILTVRVCHGFWAASIQPLPTGLLWSRLMQLEK